MEMTKATPYLVRYVARWIPGARSGFAPPPSKSSIRFMNHIRTMRQRAEWWDLCFLIKIESDVYTVIEMTSHNIQSATHVTCRWLNLCAGELRRFHVSLPQKRNLIAADGNLERFGLRKVKAWLMECLRQKRRVIRKALLILHGSHPDWRSFYVRIIPDRTRSAITLRIKAQRTQ